MTATGIVFAPLFPWPVIAALALLSLAALAPVLLIRGRGAGFRLIAATAILLALANPSLIEEDREPLQDVAALVIDESPSQTVGDRRAQLSEALDSVRRQLGRYEDTLDVRVLTLRHDRATESDRGTRLTDTCPQ